MKFYRYKPMRYIRELVKAAPGLPLGAADAEFVAALAARLDRYGREMDVSAAHWERIFYLRKVYL